MQKRRSGSIDENDVEEEEEEEEKNLVSAKRRLETIQQKVELATSTKSKADETEKRFKSVAKIAKRRYGYVLFRNDEARLQECLLAFRDVVNATGTFSFFSRVRHFVSVTFFLFPQVHFIARVCPEPST